MWALLLGLSFGQGTVDEEVVVYEDAFARWNDTRWYVEGEVLMPVPLVLGVDRKHALRTAGTQVRMVLNCNFDHAGKKRAEVDCAIEDISWKALAVSGAPGPRRQALLDANLQALDQATSAATLQLQVRSDGRVTNVDLEGIEARNTQDRLLQEGIRQVLAQAVGGFHLHLRDPGSLPEVVRERNAKLMQMPSPTASRGSSMLTHSVARHPDGYDVLTTEGSGMVATRLPNPSADETPARSYRSDAAADAEVAVMPLSDEGPVSVGDAYKGSLGAEETMGRENADGDGPGVDLGPTGANVETAQDTIAANINDAARVLGPEITYELEARGLAVYDPATGILAERVWWVKGAPTASSAGGTLNTPFRNVGRFQQLGRDDAPDTGSTELVVWSAGAGSGLSAWVDLDPLPGDQAAR